MNKNINFFAWHRSSYLLACFFFAFTVPVLGDELLIIDFSPNLIGGSPWGQSSLDTIDSTLRLHVFGTDTNGDPDIVRFEEGSFQADFGVNLRGAGWRDITQTQQAAGFEFNIATNTAPAFQRLVNGSGNDIVFNGGAFDATDRSRSNDFITGNITGSSTTDLSSGQTLLIVDFSPNAINGSPWGQSSLSTIDSTLRLHVFGTDTNGDPNIVRFEEGSFQADFGVNLRGAGWRDITQTQQAAGFEFNIATNTAAGVQRLVNGSDNDVFFDADTFSAFDRSLDNDFIAGNITGSQLVVPEPGSMTLLVAGCLLMAVRRRDS